MPTPAPPTPQKGSRMRYVTDNGGGVVWTDSTPSDDKMKGRYRIYRLCLCEKCGGRGRLALTSGKENRCKSCRGEGRSLEVVATATDPESVGVALITLAAEGEFDECPIGVMDRPEGQSGRWLVKPWLPSPRNLSDAGRVLQTARQR